MSVGRDGVIAGRGSGAICRHAAGLPANWAEGSGAVLGRRTQGRRGDTATCCAKGLFRRNSRQALTAGRPGGLPIADLFRLAAPTVSRRGT